METRRIVTGHSPDGSAVFVSDERIQAEIVDGGNAKFVEVWATGAFPSDNNGAATRPAASGSLIESEGSVLRLVELAPGSRSPMHRTVSLDYGIVLEGVIDLELDGDRKTRIFPGDVVVQRGTMHAWTNPGPQVARMAFVLLAATPIVIDGTVVRDEMHAVDTPRSA